MTDTVRLITAAHRAQTEGVGVRIRTTPFRMQPVGALHDVILQPGARLVFRNDRRCGFLLLPLFGGVDVDDRDDFVGVPSFRFVDPAIESLILRNPLDDYASQLLLLEAPELTDSACSALSFTERNQLHNLYETGVCKVYIGSYDLRHAAEHVFHTPPSAVLAFAIGGAFEVEDRLLEVRDALWLPGVSSIEFEALSQDALLLLVAFGLG
ncbi:MAG TPA: hypothetical protein VK183_08980 [Flavobacterium sp.]|nr:hypothetical protein [Flavobacterium sp.]